MRSEGENIGRSGSESDVGARRGEVLLSMSGGLEGLFELVRRLEEESLETRDGVELDESEPEGELAVVVDGLLVLSDCCCCWW